MPRTALLGGLIALLSLFAAQGALAGGWAVTTLDSVPDRFDAGQRYTIGYTIRQHGLTPINLESMGEQMTTEIRISQQGAKTLRFPGSQSGPVGHYVATVSFPAAGAWSWDVTQGPFEAQSLGNLTVYAPGAVTVGAPAAPVPAGPEAALVPPTAPAPGARAAEPDPLLLTGLILALAGAAALFGTRLAAFTRRTSRA
ncbi:hypothetical protein BH18CHL2_BH18CHL2_11740 [soil metagenome]